jgi:hypothetical protein
MRGKCRYLDGHNSCRIARSSAIHQGEAAVQGDAIWISRNGQNHGPYTTVQLMAWLAEGRVRQDDQAWCGGHVWRPLGDILREAGCQLPPVAIANRVAPMPAAGPDTIIRRIADYERASGILWIVLGSIQCLTLVGIIAGIWNILAGVSRLRAVPLILQRDPGVPSMVEGIGQLVVIGLLNVLLGGVIGVVFVAFDFYIRDVVLQNRHLFGGAPAASPQAVQGA